jgi:hypothetical protein
VLKGVAREFGRSKCFLVYEEGIRRSSVSKIPALRWSVPPLNESREGAGNTNSKDGRYEVSGAGAKSEQARDGHLEVLVDHSTEGSK